MAAADELDVGGRRLAIRHLDRVIFPRAGTTKAQVFDYYVRIAGAMLPHLRDRLLPETRPLDARANIDYCVVNELATLLWAVNLGSIELHTSLHLRDELERPTVLAFDLDPGEGAGSLECCEVALRLRELLAGVGIESFCKTSGSRGVQVYVPLNSDAVSYDVTKPASRRIAELLESQTPDRVVSRMQRALRAGKVLVDWSQNTTHKSMVCAYSIRAKERPTVSTPVAWDEVESAIDAGDPRLLVFEIGDVLERVAAHGDAFAPVLSLQQQLQQRV